MFQNISHYIKGKRTQWVKAANLTVGAAVAVADTDKNEMFWDEVVSIKKVGREQVYDIEVEGTHNFVGNGIIAHNTYITNGNIGIGTTSPAGKLAVGASSQFTVDSSGDIIKLKNLTYAWPSAHTTNGVLTNNGSGTLTWATLGASAITPDSLDFTEFKDAMTLDASTTVNMAGFNFGFQGTGNVGIGTTGPTSKLHVFSASSGTTAHANMDDFVIEGSGNTGMTILTSTTGSATLAFGKSGSVYTPYAGIVGYDMTNDALYFYTASEEKVRITSQGNVGIGTTNPGVYKLNVAGGQYNSGGLTLAGDLRLNNNQILNSAGTASILLSSSPTTTNNTLDSGTWLIENTVNTSLPALTVNQAYASNDIFRAQASGSNMVTIKYSGNVGIGTTNPIHRLDVVGSTTWDDTARFVSTGTSSGLELYTSTTTRNGLVYGAGANFGLLSADTSWGVRISDTDAQIYHPLTLDSSLTITGTLDPNGAITFPTTGISGAGAGSGLDADLLDGQSSAYYMPASTDNWVNTTGDTMTGPLVFSATNLDINRVSSAHSGISWYGNYANWSTYMSPAGTAGSGPRGDLITPSGTYVTSWGLRNYIENNAGYGWTFESAVGIGTTAPAVKFEIRASDGLFHSYGAGVIDGTLTSGLINGQDIDSTANFTGTMAVATDVTSPYYKVTAATGNGVCFWQDCTNYKIHMGTGAEYQYGPVTDYSIKMNMNSGASTRGWTWGYAGSTPVAAISGGGNMQIAGNFVAMGNVGIGTTSPTGKLQIVGDTYFGNSAGTAGVLYLYGSTAGVTSTLQTTNGNLHIDAANGAYTTYLNYYRGTGGVYFGNGATGSNANVSAAGAYTGTSLNVGAGTITSGLINSQTISSAANFTGTLTLPGYLSITGASDTSGNLRFSAANPYISASSYFVAPGGAYFNSGTVYTEAQIQARGGIADDGGVLEINDDANIGNGDLVVTNSTGQVGIGRTPGAKLDIQAAGIAGGYNIRTQDSNGATTMIQYDSGTLAINNPNGGDHFVVGSDAIHVVAGGNVGIGIANPGTYKLNVNGTAHFNDSITTQGSITGYFTYSGTDYFVCKTSSGGGVTATLRDCAANDYAEYFTADGELEPGDILSAAKNLDPNPRRPYRLTKSTVENDPKLTGAVSTKGLIPNSKLEDTDMLVALVGQIPLKVSNKNGSIKHGDSITSSTIAGFGIKAVRAGATLGKALEEFDPQNGKGEIISCPAGTPADITCGKILIFINVGWFDPDSYLTGTGDLSIITGSTSQPLAADSQDRYKLADTSGNLLNRIGAFGKIITASLESGLIKTKLLTAEDKIVSPVVETSLINTNGGDLAISGFGTLLVKGTAEFTGNVGIGADLAVAGDATISGDLTADTGYFKKIYAGQIEGLGNVSGLEDQVASLSAQIDELAALAPTSDASSSAVTDLLASIASWSLPDPSKDVKIEGNLRVTGITSLAQVVTAGSISQDGTLILENGNAINNLIGTLYLQNRAGGGIDILAGKVTIDTSGNAVFEGDLTVKGNLFAGLIKPIAGGNIVFDLSKPANEASSSSAFSRLIAMGIDGQAVFTLDASGSADFAGDITASGSGLFAQVKINRPVYASEPDPFGVITATASAGLAKIPAGRNQVTIASPFVTDSSLIYLTPIGSTDNQVIYLARTNPLARTFTAAIDQILTKEIIFSWWIIN